MTRAGPATEREMERERKSAPNDQQIFGITAASEVSDGRWEGISGKGRGQGGGGYAWGTLQTQLWWVI